MKTSLRKDRNNQALQCFTPVADVIEVTSGSAIDVSDYSIVCFDEETDIYFNGESSKVYSTWPAHSPLGIGLDVNTITFSTSGNLMYMK